MNRLILLGNGFDLAHGLPTRYGDFIFKYCKEEILCCLKDHYINKKSTFDESFLDLKYIEKTGIIMSVSDQYKNVKNQIIDKDDLLSLFGNEIDWTSIHCKNSDSSKSIKRSYMECSNSFVYNLITGNNGRNWSDIEAYFYNQLMDCLGLDNLNSTITKEKDEILKNVSTLNIEFANVIGALGNYLSEYVEKKHVFEPQQEFIDILSGNEKTKSTLVLNFNYTKTVDMYLPYLQKHNPTQHIQIHGKLKYYRENPMIFGFGDEYDKLYKVLEEYNDNALFHHIKSFGYFRTNNYKNMESFVESEPYEIFLIGHSCGLSDRTLLKYLFEHQHCQSIKIFHYQDKKNDFFKSRNNYINVTQEISRHFKDKAEMRNKIVPFEKLDFCPQVKLKEIS